MSYDDRAFQQALTKALEGIEIQPPSAAQYAARRRNHDRLVRAGLVKPSEQDPEALRAWLGGDPDAIS